MDNYSDVDEAYRMSLEKVILDAGLKLPRMWPRVLTKKERRDHEQRVKEVRANR